VLKSLFAVRGWLSNELLGNWLLDQAMEDDVRFKQDKIIGINVPGGLMNSIQLLQEARISSTD